MDTVYTIFSSEHANAAGGYSKSPTHCYVTDPEQWNAARLLLKQLYIVEKKALKEVMHIMQAEHDFNAT